MHFYCCEKTCMLLIISYYLILEMNLPEQDDGKHNCYNLNQIKKQKSINITLYTILHLLNNKHQNLQKPNIVVCNNYNTKTLYTYIHRIKKLIKFHNVIPSDLHFLFSIWYDTLILIAKWISLPQWSWSLVIFLSLQQSMLGLTL